MTYILIDSPITWYSKKTEALEWLDYLKTMDQDNAQVKAAISDANEILAFIVKNKKAND